MSIKEFYANQVLNFIQKYSPIILEQAKKLSPNPKQLIRQYILKHMDYGTISIVWDKNEIIGVCNFDVKNTEAHILNCVVHPQYRNKDCLKKLTRRALDIFPFLEFVTFKRPLRSNSKPRSIPISRLI